MRQIRDLPGKDDPRVKWGECFNPVFLSQPLDGGQRVLPLHTDGSRRFRRPDRILTCRYCSCNKLLFWIWHSASGIRKAAGRLDPIVPSGQVEELAALLESGGADLTISWSQGGHELGEGDIHAAKTWLSKEKLRKKVAA